MGMFKSFKFTKLLFTVVLTCSLPDRRLTYNKQNQVWFQEMRQPAGKVEPGHQDF